MGKQQNPKYSPVPIASALEGAQLALDNARQWLRDAVILIGQGSLGHAQALLLFGCEELGKATLWSDTPIGANQPGSLKDPRLIVTSGYSGRDAHHAKLAFGTLMAVLGSRLPHWQQLIDTHKEEVETVADQLESTWDNKGIAGFPDMMAQMISELRLPGIDFVTETLRLISAISSAQQMSQERMSSMYVDWNDDGFSTPLELSPAMTSELLLSAAKTLEAGCDLVQDTITRRETVVDFTLEQQVFQAAMKLDKPLKTRTAYLLVRKHPGNPDVQTVFLGATFSDRTAAEKKASELNKSADVGDNQSPWEVIAEEVPHFA